MGCCQEQQCAHEEALDVISELVLISCTHSSEIKCEDAAINGEIQLGNTKYINAPLRQRLGFTNGALPPPGKLNVVLQDDGKYHGEATLEDSANKRI